ncbi:MAG: hypothetical protein IKU07_03920 [Oscillospiraceae bacterium]|nr:hypothetical protein [Oscillospiraceae bacterium]
MKKNLPKQCSYVCLYESYRDLLKPFSDEERGRLVSAMLDYMFDGVEPDFPGNERFVWQAFQSQIDRDRASYEERCRVNRENAAKAAKAREQKAMDSDGERSVAIAPKEKENENKKENEKENEKEKEKESENKKEKEKEMPPLVAAPSAAPAVTAEAFGTPSLIPDEKDIINYCFESNLWINAKRFVEYYEARGWRLGGEPIRDWRPLVRSWADTEYDADNPYAGTLAAIEKYKSQPWQDYLKSGT